MRRTSTRSDARSAACLTSRLSSISRRRWNSVSAHVAEITKPEEADAVREIRVEHRARDEHQERQQIDLLPVARGAPVERLRDRQPDQELRADAEKVAGDDRGQHAVHEREHRRGGPHPRPALELDQRWLPEPRQRESDEPRERDRSRRSARPRSSRSTRTRRRDTSRPCERPRTSRVHHRVRGRPTVRDDTRRHDQHALDALRHRRERDVITDVRQAARARARSALRAGGPCPRARASRARRARPTSRPRDTRRRDTRRC